MQALRRYISILLAVPMLALGLPVPGHARPGEDESGRASRERVEQLVEKALVEHGVDPAQARARAAALTDEDAARVAAEIDRLPAGGDGCKLIGLLFVIVVGFAVVLVVLPFFLVYKALKASSESRTADAASEGSGESAPPKVPEPQY
jgi:hypothetical protein